MAENTTPSASAAAPKGDDGIERCFVCLEPFKRGDMIINDVNEGPMHRACAGDEPEGYVDENGDPLKPGDPIPKGHPWESWDDFKRRTAHDTALAHTPKAATCAPEGWVLVPLAPTIQQLSAGADAWLRDTQRRSSTLYAAMVKAAPAAPAAEPDAGVRELLLEARSGLQAFGGEACAHTIGRIDACLAYHPQPASPELGARLADTLETALRLHSPWDQDTKLDLFFTLPEWRLMLAALRAGHLVVPTPSPNPEPRPADVEGASYGIIDPDYARVYSIARCIAWSEGYALVMHGSFTRDLDLLAVPWAEKATDAEHLVRRISLALDDLSLLTKDPNAKSQATQKPHGRLAWTLTFNAFGDPRFVDISVMPTVTASPPAPPATPSHPAHRGAEEGLERVRHIKSGTEYEVLGEAETQVSVTNSPVLLHFEGSRVTVYRSVGTGKLLCRFTDEFRDGSFETLANGVQPVATDTAGALTDAARDVLAERRRQVGAEGWTPEHDDAHTEGEMAAAASCYALATVDGRKSKMLWLLRAGIPLSWPWDAEWWKRGPARQMLVKAGALTLAEIERLDRVTLSSATADQTEGRP